MYVMNRTKQLPPESITKIVNLKVGKQQKMETADEHRGVDTKLWNDTLFAGEEGAAVNYQEKSNYIK